MVREPRPLETLTTFAFCAARNQRQEWLREYNYSEEVCLEGAP